MKRLYRTGNDRMIAGVCSGLAAYFEIDVILVRLLWILAVLLGGTGVLAYIIAWIIIPETSETAIRISKEGDQGNKKIAPEVGESQEKRQQIAGLILIGLGVVFLVQQFFPWHILKYLKYFWPLLFIALGFFLLIGNRKEC